MIIKPQSLKKNNKNNLYLVSTPIGNLKDVTFRAIDTLRKSDYILCEDTRVSQKLLNKYEIKSQLISNHKFNEKKNIKKIIEIGSLEGGSTAAFHFYFLNAKIHCLDISFDRNKIVSRRITKHYVDQSDEEQLKSFINNKLIKNDLDIVIDDGAHKANDILITFKNLFPKIKKNGWYVIEDLSKS